MGFPLGFRPGDPLVTDCWPSSPQRLCPRFPGGDRRSRPRLEEAGAAAQRWSLSGHNIAGWF